MRRHTRRRLRQARFWAATITISATIAIAGPELLHPSSSRPTLGPTQTETQP